MIVPLQSLVVLSACMCIRCWSVSLHGGSIVAEGLVTVDVIFTTEEDVLELVEVQAAISSLIVLLDHLAYLVRVHLFAELLHGKHNVLLGNLA